MDENMLEFQKMLLTFLEPLWLSQGQLVVRQREQMGKFTIPI